MKIFTGFDTKFDEKELQRAIQEYGSGNAILTKKHWIFLFLPLLFLLLSIGIFLLMIKVSSVQYLEDNPMLFWSVASGQCLVTFFRIIHSIQTILSIMRKYKGHAYFWSVSARSMKDGKFEHYLKHSFISLVLQFLLMVVDIVITLVFYMEDVKARFMLLGGTLLNLFFLFAIAMTVYVIIDYEMRFNIFTPGHFSIYRQKGFFKPERISIPTTNVMIKEQLQGLGAILWYGKIAIYPEAGGEMREPIKIAYVTNPSALRKKLEEFTKGEKN